MGAGAFVRGWLFTAGDAAHWLFLPPDDDPVALPDSRALWEAIWARREGIARADAMAWREQRSKESAPD